MMSRCAGAAVTLVLVLGAGVLRAGPAAADGAGPSNYVSVITSVEPPIDGARVEIVGGDSFVQVTADPGTEVLIPGYDGEPYLWITSGGEVLENERSPASHLNRSRDTPEGRIPEGVSSSAEPEWATIGDDGRVAWHDHRIHWMLDEAPRPGEDGLVQDWMVPLTVDGTDVEVSGQLLHRADVVPWAAIVALGLAAAAFALGRDPRWRTPLLATASVVATVLAVGSHRVNPPDSGASILPIVLALLALAVVAFGELAPSSVPPMLTQLAAPLAAAALLFGWVAQTIGSLWMPTIPTVLPTWVERGGTAAVLGLTCGTVVAILLRPPEVAR